MSHSGFRDLYHGAGPQGYYRAHGDEYHNPHEPAVRAAIAYAVTRWAPAGLDLSRVLDLAAGGGEVTRALLAILPEAQVEACDPFTAALYERRCGGRPCATTSFEQIATGEVSLPPEGYSCVVASCALHLAQESWLPPLALALARSARHLLVLTTLTRPEIRREWGWQPAEATSVSEEGRAVRVRWYRSSIFEP